MAGIDIGKIKNPHNYAELEQRYEEVKKVHPGKTIYMIAVPKNLPANNEERIEFAVAYIRKPTRHELQPILAMQNQGRPFDATEMLLNTCWIEGDEEIKDDDDLFMGAHTTVQGVIEVRLGVLKKS